MKMIDIRRVDMIRRDPFKREHSIPHDVLSYFTDREESISYAERYMEISTDEPLKVLMFYGWRNRKNCTSIEVGRQVAQK